MAALVNTSENSRILLSQLLHIIGCVMPVRVESVKVDGALGAGHMQIKIIFKLI